MNHRRRHPTTSFTATVRTAGNVPNLPTTLSYIMHTSLYTRRYVILDFFVFLPAIVRRYRIFRLQIQMFFTFFFSFLSLFRRRFFFKIIFSSRLGANKRASFTTRRVHGPRLRAITPPPPLLPSRQKGGRSSIYISEKTCWKFGNFSLKESRGIINQLNENLLYKFKN